MDENKLETILQGKGGTEKLLAIFKLYYSDLDDLAKRLQDNYNDDKKFIQKEQDRLALTMLLDTFDEIENN